jgi:hypothetical protein
MAAGAVDGAQNTPGANDAVVGRWRTGTLFVGIRSGRLYDRNRDCGNNYAQL